MHSLDSPQYFIEDLSYIEDRKDIPKPSLFPSWLGAMIINTQWLKLPTSKNKFLWSRICSSHCKITCEDIRLHLTKQFAKNVQNPNLFVLPLGVWEGLRFVIVALSGLLSYLFSEETTHFEPFQVHLKLDEGYLRKERTHKRKKIRIPVYIDSSYDSNVDYIRP